MGVASTILTLRKPLTRHLHAGHPWVYRDALTPFEAEPGQVATLRDRDGRFVARGLVEDGSIALRILSLVDEEIDASFWSRRVRKALTLRASLDLGDTNAYRLIHGEGDRCPGFVVDRYDRYAVLRCDGAAATAKAQDFAESLFPELKARGVENLLLKTGRGSDAHTRPLFGKAPPERLTVREYGMLLHANLLRGQKTGLFLDHRESRRRVRALSRGQSVLNLYGYTGGFSVAAGLGGATQVTTLDIAKPALEFAQSSWLANDLPAERHQTVASDAGKYLSANEQGAYGLIIADPPNFAPRQSAKPEARQAYTRLHQSCVERLAPGGLYLAASCSSHIGADEFDHTLREGALAAGAIMQRLRAWSAPADHPRLDAYPQMDYLKVRLLRRLA